MPSYQNNEKNNNYTLTVPHKQKLLIHHCHVSERWVRVYFWRILILHGRNIF